MAERKTFTAEKNARLDRVLTERLSISYGRAQSLMRRGDVKVNGKRQKTGSVNAGDEISVYMPAAAGIPVIYSDGVLLAADKPRGISVTPDGRPSPTLTEIISGQAGRSVYPCHRIDNNTAGLVLFAFDEDTCMEISRRFAAGDVKKEYRAVVLGRFPAPVEHSAYLQKDAKAALVRVTENPLPGSRPISALFEPLLTDGELTLLRITPHTGRTHQLRAELAYMGFPILGDDKYGDRDANRRYRITSQRLWSVKIELPEDMPFARLSFSIDFDDTKIL